MTVADEPSGGPSVIVGPPDARDGAVRRYVSFFHSLDAWTEYWDVYHPETRGRFYFGDGTESGLMESLLPRKDVPPVFQAWKAHALGRDPSSLFEREAQSPRVASAAVELDELVSRLFGDHFGGVITDEVRSDYLTAIHLFAVDALPAALERASKVSPDDPRYRTAGRHTIDVDMMWFAWAMQLEIAQLVLGADAGSRRRSLLLAGVSAGCSANFAWQGHRRTRPEYKADEATSVLILERAAAWADSFEGATAEVHALYRIREHGHAGV